MNMTTAEVTATFAAALAPFSRRARRLVARAFGRGGLALRVPRW